MKHGKHSVLFLFAISFRCSS